MLRTNRSLLRIARRHLMRDLRSKEELQGKLIPALQNAAKTGDVDAVLKGFEVDEKKIGKIMLDIDEMERNTFMAEYDTVDHLDGVEKWFQRCDQKLTALRQRHPSYEQTLAKIDAEVKQLHQRLINDEHIELDELHKQYLAVSRQLQGETGQLQTFVIAVSGTMKAMDELWNLRGEISKEKRDSKILTKESILVYKLLTKLDEAKDAKLQDALLKQLQKEEGKIADTFREFEKLFQLTERSFTIVMKLTVDIHFDILRTQGKLKEFLQYLERAGFPRKEFEEMAETVHREEASWKVDGEKLVAIIARGGRIQRGKM